MTPLGTSWQTTCSQSLPISPPSTMDENDTASPPQPKKPKKSKRKTTRALDTDLNNLRALQVRLYPSKAEAEKWKWWLGCARVTYNSALKLWRSAKKAGQ